MHSGQQIRNRLMSLLPLAILICVVLFDWPAAAQQPPAQTLSNDAAVQTIPGSSVSNQNQFGDNPIVSDFSSGLSNMAPQPNPPRIRQLSNVPDDIGYQLQESDYQRASNVGQTGRWPSRRIRLREFSQSSPDSIQFSCHSLALWFLRSTDSPRLTAALLVARMS